MKMINKKFNIVLSIFLLVLIVFSAYQTFAWISLEKQYTAHFDLGTFKLTMSATAGPNNEPVSLENEKGNYKINGLTSADSKYITEILKSKNSSYKENLIYIDTFKLNIKIDSALTAGYVRIKLLDEWIVNKRFLNFNKEKVESVFINGTSDFSFKLAQGWVYDPVTKYCYYTNLIEMGTTNLDIPFITSGIPYDPKINAYIVETCDLILGTSIQAVQANRVEEIWGITEIPKPQPQV